MNYKLLLKKQSRYLMTLSSRSLLCPKTVILFVLECHCGRHQNDMLLELPEHTPRAIWTASSNESGPRGQHHANRIDDDFKPELWG